MAALLKRWDGVKLKPSQWRIPLSQGREALRRLPRERQTSLRDAARQVERFHRWERRRLGTTWAQTADGLTVGQRIVPVDSVGVYVPGGRFAYPSSVLMAALPAKVAGVRRIVMVTPPRHVTDEVLAAAALAGVTEIYRIGGIGAVGALAYGTRTIPKVDLIVGPGGAWVTEAKRQVFGEVGIDLIAGPSEVAVLADRTTSPRFAAADLMAQTEHDPLARAVLLSPDARTIAAVKGLVEKRFRPQCSFVKTKNWADAVAKANALAPEHLSLLVKKPERLLNGVRNAGAIFLGPWSPVAAGDYWAGPSHVLPTGRAARFMSGLSVQTFLKRSSIIRLSEPLMRKKARTIARLAEAEGLVYHAASLKARLNRSR